MPLIGHYSHSSTLMRSPNGKLSPNVYASANTSTGFHNGCQHALLHRESNQDKSPEPLTMHRIEQTIPHIAPPPPPPPPVLLSRGLNSGMNHARLDHRLTSIPDSSTRSAEKEIDLFIHQEHKWHDGLQPVWAPPRAAKGTVSPVSLLQTNELEITCTSFHADIPRTCGETNTAFTDPGTAGVVHHVGTFKQQHFISQSNYFWAVGVSPGFHECEKLRVWTCTP
ncbi:unnamed protein product [Pleuronectes platessa]|uniref:Uncharacterized protein n=1 Tax=Pleuronectes platessa TaxID=8262 RepID=A0A9N7UEB2_PLEPL|nr:unnamed protein product [Pleuronectes platessa]